MFQVAKISKPLVSVAKLNQEGWRVVFDPDQSFIQHKRSGKMVALKRERGVFIVEAYMDTDPKTLQDLAKAMGGELRRVPKDDQLSSRQGR